jgi:hypothetical protein
MMGFVDDDEIEMADAGEPVRDREHRRDLHQLVRSAGISCGNDAVRDPEERQRAIDLFENFIPMSEDDDARALAAPAATM